MPAHRRELSLAPGGASRGDCLACQARCAFAGEQEWAQAAGRDGRTSSIRAGTVGTIRRIDARPKSGELALATHANLPNVRAARAGPAMALVIAGSAIRCIGRAQVGPPVDGSVCVARDIVAAREAGKAARDSGKDVVAVRLRGPSNRVAVVKCITWLPASQPVEPELSRADVRSALHDVAARPVERAGRADAGVAIEAEGAVRVRRAVGSAGGGIQANQPRAARSGGGVVRHTSSRSCAGAGALLGSTRRRREPLAIDHAIRLIVRALRSTVPTADAAQAPLPLQPPFMQLAVEVGHAGSGAPFDALVGAEHVPVDGTHVPIILQMGAVGQTTGFAPTHVPP